MIQVPVESIETCCSCHQKIHCNRQQDNNYSDSLVTSKNFQVCNEWLLHIIFLHKGYSRFSVKDRAEYGARL